VVLFEFFVVLRVFFFGVVIFVLCFRGGRWVFFLFFLYVGFGCMGSCVSRLCFWLYWFFLLVVLFVVGGWGGVPSS